MPGPKHRKVALNVTLGADTYAAGTEVSPGIAEQITNPAAWGGQVPEVDVEDDAEVPKVAHGYSHMSVAELKAEVALRNQGRSQSARIPAKNNKGDLVAALEADDISW